MAEQKDLSEIKEPRTELKDIELISSSKKTKSVTFYATTRTPPSCPFATDHNLMVQEKQQQRPALN